MELVDENFGSWIASSLGDRKESASGRSGRSERDEKQRKEQSFGRLEQVLVRERGSESQEEKAQIWTFEVAIITERLQPDHMSIAICSFIAQPRTRLSLSKPGVRRRTAHRR